MRLKTLVFSLGCTLLVGILAACSGSAPGATGNNTSTPTVTTSDSSPTQAATIDVTKTTDSSVIVSVGAVPSHQAVGSTLGVLTTLKGLTLYVHEWQGASGFTCDGSCASTWEPLVYSGTGTPTATTQLPGKLTIGSDAQGRKVVFYQGYPLYTYVGDKKPGDFNAPLADNSPWQPATPSIRTGL